MSSHYEKFLVTGEVKCIDDEIPFEIPDGWVWCRMGEVIEFVNGRAYKKEELLLRGKYKVLRVGNFFTNNLWYYSDLELPKEKYCFDGDLLYAWSASFGPKIWCGEKTIFHYHIWNVKFNKSILSRDYLYFFLLFDKTQVKASTTGSTMVHVSMENMKPRLIPIPPIDEQKRIVKRIETLLPLLDKYSRLSNVKSALDDSVIKNLKKSILQEAIQGRLVPQNPEDEPASKLLERIREEKQKLLKEGKLKKKDITDSVIFRGDDNAHYEKVGNSITCIDDEIPFDIPENWAWCRLKEIVYNHGQTTPQDTFSYIDIGSIDNKRLCLNAKETILGADKAPSRARRVVKQGDILYSTVRPYLHNMCIVDRPFSATPIASTGLAVMACYSGVLHEYLFSYLQSPQFDYYANDGDNAKGVAYPAINDEKLYLAFIPIPPLAEQKRIVRRINELFMKLK